MADNLDVEIADMDLIRQVFERQEQHFQAVDQYVSSTCRVPGALTGALSFVAGDYGSACDDAHTGFVNGQTVASTCATKISETRAALLETDRQQYERYAAHLRSLGQQPPPYVPPGGGGELPPADGPAGSAPGAEAKPKITFPYPDWVKKGGEIMGYDPNDPFKRSGPNGADYLDPKYWGRRAVESYTDGVRHDYGLDTPGQHRAPLPNHIPGDVASTVKGLGNTIATPISAINNGIGIVTAGQHVQAAQATHESVSASADGPSNTSGIDWANSQSGGDW